MIEEVSLCWDCCCKLVYSFCYFLSPLFNFSPTHISGVELVFEHMNVSFLRYFEVSQHFSHYFNWKKHGLTQEDPPTIFCEDVSVDNRTEKDCTIISTDSLVQMSSTGKSIFKQRMKYEIYRDGKIKICHNVIPQKQLYNIPSLPRVGVSLELQSCFRCVEYYGRGPHENYPDRKVSAAIGVYHTTPSKMGYDYIVPSENGNRCDCRWVRFESNDDDDDDMIGLMIMSDDDNDDSKKTNNNNNSSSSSSSFNFSALLHSADELDKGTCCNVYLNYCVPPLSSKHLPFNLRSYLSNSYLSLSLSVSCLLQLIIRTILVNGRMVKHQYLLMLITN